MLEVNLFGELDLVDNEKYLRMNYPDILLTRYGSIPERIYVRKCYEELYDISTAFMMNQKIERPVALFTGVPGIGKSLFLLYFVFRFYNDNRRFYNDNPLLDKRFALEFEYQKYKLFTPSDSHGIFRVQDVTDVCLVSDCLVLSDIKAPVEPGGRTKCLLIFSSPNQSRYKETMKTSPCFTYTMPTWNEDELLCINQFASGWFGNFVTFGGVPRHVLWNGIDNDPRKLLHTAINTKGGNLARNFFSFGHGDVDPDMSFMLVHINPRWDYNSHTWSYIGEPDYSFASDEIFLIIEQTYQHALLAQALQIFNVGVASDTYGSVSAGHLFEKVCLWFAPLAKKSIHVTFFNKTIPSCSYNLPAMTTGNLLRR